jgi:hypothetical protein
MKVFFPKPRWLTRGSVETSENVVYELGAARKMWQNWSIIFKEGIRLPSDFKDLG